MTRRQHAGEPQSARPGTALVVHGALPRMKALAERLLDVGAARQLVERLDDALPEADASVLTIDVVLLPVELASRALKGDLKRLRRAWPAAPPAFVAVGPEPARAERRLLRAAGIRLGLWEPFDDASLRFQLNRARCSSEGHRDREALRVPARLAARVDVGGRSKDAVVYSLSVKGAFLETARASMDGARLGLEIQLPGQRIETRAQVVFANVPGNVQRPSLPLGMAVRFEAIDRDGERALARFVDEALGRLEV